MLSQRGQLAVASFALWFLLALWCVSAFWQHVDELQPTYPAITKLGAIGAEVAVLILVWWHCFNKHINVRKWALILGVALSAVAIIHAGALRGMLEAQTAQFTAEKRLTEQLIEMSKEQLGAVKSVDTGTQKERLAKNRAALAEQSKIAANAQKEVADAIKGGAEKVKDSSILPRWYLNGWMYSLLFILSLIFVGIPAMMMMNKEDIDEDYDGIPDHLQQGRGGSHLGVVAQPVEGFARASRDERGELNPKARSDQEQGPR